MIQSVEQGGPANIVKSSLNDTQNTEYREECDEALKILIQPIYIFIEKKVRFVRTEKLGNRQRNKCDQRDFYNLAEKRTYYFEMLMVSVKF